MAEFENTYVHVHVRSVCVIGYGNAQNLYELSSRPLTDDTGVVL